MAPDLTVEAVQISSPDAVCGQLSNTINITARISNIGDLRVGPGVVVGFYGDWNAVPYSGELLDGIGNALQVVLQTSLEPGDSVLVSVDYDAANNTPNLLPDSIRVAVDDASQARECNEDNNELESEVEAGQSLADLTIELGSVNLWTCPNPQVPTTVRNIGSAPATDHARRWEMGGEASSTLAQSWP